MADLSSMASSSFVATKLILLLSNHSELPQTNVAVKLPQRNGWPFPAWRQAVLWPQSWFCCCKIATVDHYCCKTLMNCHNLMADLFQQSIKQFCGHKADSVVVKLPQPDGWPFQVDHQAVLWLQSWFCCCQTIVNYHNLMADLFK